MSSAVVRAVLVSTSAALFAGTVLTSFAARAQNWTGCYLGVHGGYDWGSNRTTEPGDTFKVTSSGDGGGGGVFAGCSYQPSFLVLGVEADYNKNSVAGSYIFPSNEGVLFEKHSDYSVRLKLGVAVESSLLYATGGLAYGRFTHGYVDTVATERIGNRQRGWTIGAGIARQLTPNWIVQIEYRFSDFGSVTNFSDLYSTFYKEEPRFQSVRFGIGYRFATQ